ncbi:putative secreted protein (Por secretion system target) [Mesonia algae]|uniref:Putative secreted protein (Por secretion system target) n=1 Tax=Mesonia algae TaxID=213248 RepID=A0A2W7IHQ3_9FLAO|nr:BspA family leucine-rich repeat surface protein [Mesonia algae]PZW38837.1 putative secreted protein (Por secretion system target) [Mesonia algae]
MKYFYITLFLLLSVSFVSAQNQAFITTWEVTNNDLEITIPVYQSVTLDYNYTVDFGDGTVLNNQTGDAAHTYNTAGIYTVSITGDFPRIYFFNNYGSGQKLASVEQWGDIQWQSMESAFSYCPSLMINATDAPDLSQVINLSEMFAGCRIFNQSINHWDVSNIINMTSMFDGAWDFNQPLNNWDVSNVTNMSTMFRDANDFNQNINNWDVSNVTNMSSMFASLFYPSNFNQPLNNWDVSNVTDMSSMFRQLSLFNQPLNNWDVSNVINMEFMFEYVTDFDQPLNNWDVSGVTNMKSMFSSAYSFNQNINNWDVSNVTDMSGMFSMTQSFNQPLNNWDVSSIVKMGGNSIFVGDGGMFEHAEVFNQDISGWDVSNVQNFGSMFASADAFNQDLSSWDVSSATTMTRMFNLAISFNQPINIWDVSNVTNMSNMFGGNPAFNQSLFNWDVSSVTDMTRMFLEATAFNQDISGWDVVNVEFMGGMFADASAFNQDISTWVFHTNLSFDVYNDVGFLENSGLDVQNYDLLLAQFASLNLNDKALGADGLEYCDTTSRNQLITNLGWVINGDTPSAGCTTPIDPFITTWEVTAGDLSITIPTNNSSGYYNYKVDFGDSTVLTNQTSDASHTYANPGTYTVSITGDFPRINFSSNFGMQAKLRSVEQWGDIQWHSMAGAFKGCGYLFLNATDTPDLSLVTDMTRMFAEASGFNSGNLNSWDVSTITNMSQLFKEAYLFDQALNNWDVSNVTDVQAMFEEAHSFNQALSNWDVSSVTNMSTMFKNANAFNQTIDNWNVSSVSDMSDMFHGANIFNQPLNTWNVSSVTHMNKMFYGASSFNQAINNWDVSNVELMRAMFRYATDFNQDLSSWNFNQNVLFNSYDLGFLDSCGLDTYNYDSLLAQFVSLNLTNKSLGADGMEYCDTNTRNQLITNLNWTIEDDSLFVDCNLFSPDAFITTWEVDNAIGLNISIPTTGTGYQYAIDFGDGTALGNQTGDANHTYMNPGTYTVRITGDFPRIHFYNSGMEEKLKTIEQWGIIEWQSMENAFNGCAPLIINATDVPDLSQVTDMSRMFSQCENLNQPLNHWDVSNVTNMSSLFDGVTTFNQPLNNWDVSNVINMSRMFSLADAFNQSLNSWDVSSVMNMQGLFMGADSFNQSLTNWGVSNVSNMGGMFAGTGSFNHPLNNWDVSNVTNMANMFTGADSFNQPIDTWNVSNVTDMYEMFAGAISFNQPLDNWNVSNVLDMMVMFGGAVSFNQDISSWNFNSNIDHFGETFSNSGLNIQNYDAVLQRFVQLGITNKVLGAHELFYCDEIAHNELTNNLGWTIMGDSFHNDCEMIVEEDVTIVQLNIYPNPTDAKLYIDSNLPLNQVNVYNLQGKTLISSNVEGNKKRKVSLNVSSLSSGVYFVRVIGNGLEDTYKIIKK